MTTNRPSPATPVRSLGPVDIYYALARHKRKILICAALGLIAGVGLMLFAPKRYRSEAALLVRYVLDSRSTIPGLNAGQVSSPDSRGETVVAAEAAILSSFDVAQATAASLSTNTSLSTNALEKFMAPFGGGSDAGQAAAIIQRSLLVSAPRRGSTINLAFDHPDASMARTTLRELVKSYLEKHKSVHQPQPSESALRDLRIKQTGLKNDIASLEGETLTLLSTNTVFSVEDMKKVYVAEIGSIAKDLLEADAQLEERKALFNALTNEATGSKLENVPGARPPQERVDKYRTVNEALAAAHRRLNELQTLYTDESKMVIGLRANITKLEEEKRAIETANPELTLSPSTSGTNRLPADVVTLGAQITSLESRKKRLREREAKVLSDASRLSALELKLAELEREKRIAETNYAFVSMAQQQSDIANTLRNEDISNISEIQAPTPAFPTTGQKAKIAAVLALGGLLLGLALAFLSEFYLDRTVRRPLEMAGRLNAPLFISIPEARINGRALLVAPGEGSGSGSTSLVSEAMAQSGTANSKHEDYPWVQNLELQRHLEALRDRLVSHFETLNLVHKPKLVAVTACGDGAGVTTIASGLAASLSENSEGKVLLVDMHGEQGSAHPLYRGKPVVALTDVLDSSKRGSSESGSKLLVARVGEADNRLAGALPKRFGHLVPKMKASDLDYIIFDMPPVNQVSMTARLAGFMDMVFLVIESERTRQESVERALAQLTESRASIATVLNKSRSYLPKRLEDAL